MEILNFDSYDKVKLFWMELNRTYKSGELSVDWTANELIWNHFYKNRGFTLNIVVGLKEDKCYGIFPLIFGDHDMSGECFWSFTEDFIISKEYFCPPGEIHHFLEYLPPHFSDDLSSFYTPEEPQLLGCSYRGLIDIKHSQEEYYQSLKKKHRHDLKRTWRINGDLEVTADSRLRWDEIQGVLKQQLDYWQQKKGAISESYVSYSKDKTITDLLLMRRAEEMGKLLALYFYLNHELVAANFSVRRERDRLDDYMCLRNCQPHFASRGLGIFAILKNIEHCRQLGIRYYDLSSCLTDYKKKFINMETLCYYMMYDGIMTQSSLPQQAQPSLTGVV
jgi:hypothetical protein